MGDYIEKDYGEYYEQFKEKGGACPQLHYQLGRGGDEPVDKKITEENGILRFKPDFDDEEGTYYKTLEISAEMDTESKILE